MHTTQQRPGFPKHAAAILIDTLLMMCLWFLGYLLLLPFGVVPWLDRPWEAFQALSIPFLLLLNAYRLLISFLYLGSCWVYGGQTLGLRMTQTRLVSEVGIKVTWWQAVVRFFSSILAWIVFGLGFIWVLLPAKRRTWHDLLSKTHIVRVSKTE